MKEVVLAAKTIKGNKIRTRNGNMEEIIGLWSQVSEMNLSGNIYAVYFNYESDHTGEFDFLIGNELFDSEEEIILKKDNYLGIEIKEATPEKVGQTWQEIWRNQAIYDRRLFTADFEEYLPTGEVTIYLAVK
jgi:predicted transcriptional regulator YdeE